MNVVSKTENSFLLFGDQNIVACCCSLAMITASVCVVSSLFNLARADLIVGKADRWLVFKLPNRSPLLMNICRYQSAGMMIKTPLNIAKQGIL